MKKKILNADKEFPWLSKAEATQLMSGCYFDSEGALHNSEGCVRCTGVISGTGKRCRNFSVPGELFCRIHGGVLARAKAGKQRVYSAFIQNAKLKSSYESIMNKKEVSGIQEELALLRTLLANVINKSTLKEAKDVKNIAAIIGEIRQLVDDCTKTEIRLGQLIDIGKITIIVKALADIVQKYVKDPGIIEQIAVEFDNVIWPAPLASTPQPERTRPLQEVPLLPG